MKGVVVIGWFLTMLWLTFNGPSIQKSLKESKFQFSKIVMPNEKKIILSDADSLEFLFSKNHNSVTNLLIENESEDLDSNERGSNLSNHFRFEDSIITKSQTISFSPRFNSPD